MKSDAIPWESSYFARYLKLFQSKHNDYFVFELLEIMSECIPGRKINFLFRHSYNEQYSILLKIRRSSMDLIGRNAATLEIAWMIAKL